MCNLCGSDNTTTQSSTVTIPAEYKPYITDVLTRAKAASNLPYTPYGGQRVAGLSADEQAAYAGLRSAVGASEADFNRARELGNLSGRATTDYNIGDYMNPFQQQVIDRAKEEAIRQDDIMRMQRDSRAINAGAFGGNRRTLYEAEAGRNLGQNLSDIQMQGSLAGWQNAMNQINADRQAQGTASGRFTDIGKTAAGVNIQDLGALEAAGRTQRDIQQQGLTTAYQDFVQQRDYPKTQTQWYSDLIRGNIQPTFGQNTATTQPPPSMLSQIAGLGLGIFGLMGIKRGGAVRDYSRRYASGGPVRFQMGGTPLAAMGLMNNQALEDALNNPTLPQAQREIIQRILTARGHQPQEPRVNQTPLVNAGMYPPVAAGPMEEPAKPFTMPNLTPKGPFPPTAIPGRVLHSEGIAARDVPYNMPAFMGGDPGRDDVGPVVVPQGQEPVGALTAAPSPTITETPLTQLPPPKKQEFPKINTQTGQIETPGASGVVPSPPTAEPTQSNTPGPMGAAQRGSGAEEKKPWWDRFSKDLYENPLWSIAGSLLEAKPGQTMLQNLGSGLKAAGAQHGVVAKGRREEKAIAADELRARNDERRAAVSEGNLELERSFTKWKMDPNNPATQADLMRAKAYAAQASNVGGSAEDRADRQKDREMRTDLIRQNQINTYERMVTDNYEQQFTSVDEMNNKRFTPPKDFKQRIQYDVIRRYPSAPESLDKLRAYFPDQVSALRANPTDANKQEFRRRFGVDPELLLKD